MATLALFGMPGWQEVAITLAIMFLLFSRRIPEATRSLGQSILEFKRGLRNDATSSGKHLRDHSG